MGRIRVMDQQEVPAVLLRSREARRGVHIPGEEGEHRMRLAEVGHMVQEVDDHSLDEVEDADSPVVDSLGADHAKDLRRHLAGDHQEDLRVGSRLVEEDSTLLVVEEGHLEEDRTPAVEDKASGLGEDNLRAGLLVVGASVQSRDK